MATSNSNAQADLVLCEGWLVLRNRALLPASRRYFRLFAAPGGSGPIFAGYQDASLTDQFIHEPVTALRSVVPKRGSDDCSFTVHFADQSFFLRAPSAADASRWINVLRAHLDAMKRRDERALTADSLRGRTPSPVTPFVAPPPIRTPTGKWRVSPATITATTSRFDGAPTVAAAAETTCTASRDTSPLRTFTSSAPVSNAMTVASQAAAVDDALRSASGASTPHQPSATVTAAHALADDDDDGDDDDAATTFSLHMHTTASLSTAAHTVPHESLDDDAHTAPPRVITTSPPPPPQLQLQPQPVQAVGAPGRGCFTAVARAIADAVVGTFVARPVPIRPATPAGSRVAGLTLSPTLKAVLSVSNIAVSAHTPMSLCHSTFGDGGPLSPTSSSAAAPAGGGWFAVDRPPLTAVPLAAAQRVRPAAAAARRDAIVPALLSQAASTTTLNHSVVTRTSADGVNNLLHAHSGDRGAIPRAPSGGRLAGIRGRSFAVPTAAHAWTAATDAMVVPPVKRQQTPPPDDPQWTLRTTARTAYTWGSRSPAATSPDGTPTVTGAGKTSPAAGACSVIYDSGYEHDGRSPTASASPASVGSDTSHGGRSPVVTSARPASEPAVRIRGHSVVARSPARAWPVSTAAAPLAGPAARAGAGVTPAASDESLAWSTSGANAGADAWRPPPPLKNLHLHGAKTSSRDATPVTPSPTAAPGGSVQHPMRSPPTNLHHHRRDSVDSRASDSTPGGTRIRSSHHGPYPRAVISMVPEAPPLLTMPGSIDDCCSGDSKYTATQPGSCVQQAAGRAASDDQCQPPASRTSAGQRRLTASPLASVLPLFAPRIHSDALDHRHHHHQQHPYHHHHQGDGSPVVLHGVLDPATAPMARVPLAKPVGMPLAADLRSAAPTSANFAAGFDLLEACKASSPTIVSPLSSLASTPSPPTDAAGATSSAFTPFASSPVSPRTTAAVGRHGAVRNAGFSSGAATPRDHPPQLHPPTGSLAAPTSTTDSASTGWMELPACGGSDDTTAIGISGRDTPTTAT